MSTLYAITIAFLRSFTVKITILFLMPSPYNKYFQHNTPWLFFSRKVNCLLSLVGLFLDSDELGHRLWARSQHPISVSVWPHWSCCVILNRSKYLLQYMLQYTVKDKKCPHTFNHVIVISSDIKFKSEWADLAKTFSIRLDSLLTSCVSFWRFASTGSWVAVSEPSERA